ncbi:hypothetical protein E3N88_07639 [Mikania micrantha]|uniref:Thioredoxin domain-containing protein n=1 Tax=Mikania micrantha TaxID=192012 RepID=A0A5N6PS38_9ASTR|nr:hypothetical protein E3N88_07639 [Mikania micrantha]
MTRRGDLIRIFLKRTYERCQQQRCGALIRIFEKRSLRRYDDLIAIRMNSCDDEIYAFVQAKKQTFSSLDELLEKAEKPVLVDFYATWCGPCQFMGPILNEVSISMGDTIQVVKIDTEKYPEIADKYRIEALPTFILFKDGKPCDRFEGALTANQLIQRIEGTLKVKE